MNTINRHYRLEQINLYEEQADLFSDTAKLPADILNYRPEPSFWTIQEHVVHVVETEVIAFHRYRKAVAEPGSVIPGYEGEIWASSINLAYNSEELADWIELYASLRRIAARHLRRLLDQDWHGFSYVHEGKGPVDLPEWLELYTRHPVEHRAMIDRNIWAWKESSATL